MPLRPLKYKSFFSKYVWNMVCCVLQHWVFLYFIVKEIIFLGSGKCLYLHFHVNVTICV